ncbi:tripartite tricarboxylate transporter substrate binding protein [Variovorax sp. YR752]|uniref:Bug family tripartite tricarboxylate transporter substrate binding protein n=2 Tax=unclassified Variovorax TaxID=663243 RepID=UPI000BE2D9E3|nr:tripartite tricarboxylate transporter substrate binding protein [Variovorax sp. YR752]
MRTTHPANPTARRLTLFLGTAALGLSSLVGSVANAQATWPTKSVTLLVGYPPGGQTDFAGRILTNGMQGALGQPVVIDNKAGVNGNIASVELMKAPPDGHKLLVGNGSMTIMPHVYTKLGIVDPQKMTPIGVMLQSPLVLVVPATSPIKTYAQFAEEVQARAKAGKGIDYGTGGPGSLIHVTMELLRERLGSPAMNHVPYKGSSPAMVDLMAGRLDAMFDATSVVAPFVKSGQLRPLLVTGEKRSPMLPNVPTATESGVKDFTIISFIGLYGPPGLSPDVVKKASSAMNAALRDPTVVKSIADRGDEPGGGSPGQLAEMTRAQYKMWGAVVKANNITAD